MVFHISIELPRVGRRRSVKGTKSEALVLLESQTSRAKSHGRQKPQLRVSLPPARPQSLCLDMLTRPSLPLVDDLELDKIIEFEGEPEIIDISPRRSGSPYRRQEYINSVPVQRQIVEPAYYEDGDYYDGDNTPIATRRLIIEAPRHSRSRSRSSSVASSRRSSSTRSTRSTRSDRSVSTVASADTVDSEATVLSAASGVVSENSSASKASTPLIILSDHSEPGEPKTGLPSVVHPKVSLESSSVKSNNRSESAPPSSACSGSTTRTTYRYKPHDEDDDKMSIKSYERRVSRGRCADPKERQKLRGILKVAEYAAGRSRSYSRSR